MLIPCPKKELSMNYDEYYEQYPEDWTQSDIERYEIYGVSPEDVTDYTGSGEEMFSLDFGDDSFELNF